MGMNMPEVDARTQSCITDDQARFFVENGFLVVRNVVTGEELRLVQDAMMELVERGSSEPVDDPDFLYGKGIRSGKDVLRRVEYVMEKRDVMKALLAHPFILRSVEKLQGNNFVPTWDSMVLKAPDEGVIVPWHRDAEVPEGCTDPRPIFNVDFYLDQADLRTCLWVIPGSNRWSRGEAQARCAQPGFETDDAVPVPMNPGDVIFHDITVLHGSPSGDGNPLRRTIYYEFRPGEVEAACGPHTLEYLSLKQHLLLDAIGRRRAAAYAADESPFVYQPSGAFAIRGVRPPETYRYAHGDYWRR